LLAHDTDLLTAAQATLLHTLANRRLQGEPLAYVTGHKEFFGLDLLVDERVLVPRPDSETLVDWALAVLPRGSASVLDLGTGSGAIALALKATRPALRVHATDMSHDALAAAVGNAQRLGLDIGFSQGAWLSALPTETPPFDCIVSNPPYIALDDAHLCALTFEPQQALTSGVDGLDDIRHIVQNASAHLKPGGWLLLEHGHDQSESVRTLLLKRGFSHVTSRQDLAGIERCSGGQKSP
jgi:release factor glutamine methyltransferase